MPRVEEYRTLDELLREDFRAEFAQAKNQLLAQARAYRTALRRWRSRHVDSEDAACKPAGVEVQRAVIALMDVIRDWRHLGITPESMGLIPAGPFEGLVAAAGTLYQLLQANSSEEVIWGAHEVLLAAAAALRGDE